MWGVYSPSNYVVFQGAMNLYTALPCSPCWLLLEFCPYDRMCPRRISPERAQEAIACLWLKVGPSGVHDPIEQVRQELARLTLADSLSGGRRVMIGSFGGSAGEENVECTGRHGPRNAATVNIAGHEASGTSDVTGSSQMNNEESSGLEFYFPVKDRAFHWVRTSSLYSPAARQRKITVKAMFRKEEIGVGIPVFDRWESGFYFRKLRSLCLSARVPYLVDLDDLIWELPRFTGSSRTPLEYLLEFPELLISGAAAITVSTPDLKYQVENRFPGKPVFLVENCPPAWIAPRSGVLIANTDGFKMGDEAMRWFIDLLQVIFRHGLSIQLLGSNHNLEDKCSDMLVHTLPEMDYTSYLAILARSDFRLALLPVENSTYSDCKSAIKAIEFISQRIPTIASDIAPYRRFVDLHGMSDFHVVPNTFEAWKPAVETVILQIPEPERQKGKEINAMLITTRETQLQQWLAVIDFLSDRRPDLATMRQLSRTVRPYRFVYSRCQPIFKPFKNLLQKHI